MASSSIPLKDANFADLVVNDILKVGERIVTNDLVATTATLNELDVNALNATSLTADTLRASELDADTVNANTVNTVALNVNGVPITGSGTTTVIPGTVNQILTSAGDTKTLLAPGSTVTSTGTLDITGATPLVQFAGTTVLESPSLVSLAVGPSASAAGATFSTAIGVSATTNSGGQDDTAIGAFANATAGSIAIGAGINGASFRTQATGSNSIAIGSTTGARAAALASAVAAIAIGSANGGGGAGASAGASSIAIGSSAGAGAATASGNASISMGTRSTAAGANSIAVGTDFPPLRIGAQIGASGTSSIAIGSASSTAPGAASTAAGSVVIGSGASDGGNAGAVCLGTGATAAAGRLLAFGNLGVVVAAVTPDAYIPIVVNGVNYRLALQAG